MAKTEKQTRRNTGTKKLSGDVAKAVEAALDKKASEIVVLDLRQTPAFTDFFVLCSGQNQRQVKAIADAIEDSLRAERVKPAHVEGYRPRRVGPDGLLHVHRACVHAANAGVLFTRASLG